MRILWTCLIPILFFGAQAFGQCPGSPPAGIECVGNGANKDITAFTVCAKITNNHASGKALMVPIGSSTDWSTFRTNLAPGVTSGACGGGSVPTLIQTAAPAWDAANTTHSVTLPSAPTIGNVVIFMTIGRASSENVQTITGCGATWVNIAAYAGTNARPEIWAGVCTTTGATITVTESLSMMRTSMAMEWSNLTGALDAAGAGSHATTFTNTTSNVTTTRATTVIFVADGLDKVATGPSSPTNSFVDAGTDGNGPGGATGYQSGSFAYRIMATTITVGTTLTLSGTGSPNHNSIIASVY